MNHSRSGFQVFPTGRPGRASWCGWNGWRSGTSATPGFFATESRELRIDWGPGYRVYFGRDGRTVIVLLCGGDKRRQDADIEKAVELWQEYGNRKKRGPRART